MAEKIDFKKTLDAYHARHGELRLVELPPTSYLMIDGHGDPNTSTSYAQALEALYPVAYTLKFVSKRELERDYVVPPLEGLWWADDMSAFTESRDKTQWDWTMMLMVPEWLTTAHVESAVSAVGAKKQMPVRLHDIRFEEYTEDLCVQTLHIGSFEDEGPVLERIHTEYIPGHGLQLTKKHHEIYLSDPRKSAPEKLRTILRQPVEYA
jgi:hypothetical protein